MRKAKLIHYHGSTVEGLEKALREGETLELGEIVVVTGDDSKEKD